MRIWFAASISSSTIGGVYRSMNQLAGELRRCGHHVEIIYDNSRANRHWLKFSLKLCVRLLLLFWKRPDWIIARSSDCLLSAVVCRIFKIRTSVAFHSHGWEERAAAIESRLPASLITNPTSWRARFIGFFLQHIALKSSGLCICGTIDEARWICKRLPSVREKIAIIPNGVTPVSQPYWPLQKDYPPSILMVGAFTWKKNLEYGVEVFRRLLQKQPEARLFIVGCGPLTERKKQLLFPLGDTVFIVESESPDKMNRWYESCPILLFPSRYEGGRPFTILEAQSRGCVVFGSHISAIRECVSHGKNGFLITGVNPVADTDQIMALLEDHELIRRIGWAAWKKAMRSSVKRQAKRLIKVLRAKQAIY